ncbi:uncharacterized protein [Mobula birostris]|uniref:uncharacterized protein isoform X4 n=1 Tax=Mobula birostris TaxID=1983395 RepID=UPI003B27DFD6
MSVDKCGFPGKLKLWCLQYGLMPRIMWPLTVNEVAMSHVEAMERKINKYVKKSLGVPSSLTNVAIHSSQTKLTIPVQSLVEEVKVAKVTLLFLLTGRRERKYRWSVLQSGDVHEKIVKELDIYPCEGPGVPCVLFVYRVSHEIQDLQNALHWVTGGGRTQKEGICAVILLQKSRDVGEGQIRTYPGLFHEGTPVHRVLWRETSGILKRRSADCHCPNTIRAIRQSLSDRTRSREHSSPVQCYGRGDVHEKIVKELKICQCEGPGVPCVLFVYKVSHENQDLRDALQWVTGGETVRKEDICSVILLQKSGDFGVNKMMTDPELFHEGTNVFQIFWTEMSVTWTSADEGHAVIQTVRQTLVDKTKSRGVFCPGSSKDQQGSETLSLCSAPTLMCSEQPDLLTSSTCTQEKSEKSSEKLQCNDSSKMKAFLNKIKFPQITVEDQQILDAPVTEHEIQKAVLSMQSVGRDDNPPGNLTSVENEQLDCSIPSGWNQQKRSRNSEKCNRSSEDRQGSETLSLCSAPTWMCSEQPDHLTPSTCTQEKSKRSSEKFQCNVQCYGRGAIHEEIVKKLNINQCERPRIPCVLFVYNVSREIQDF